MEFDWENPSFEWNGSLTPKDVEESFEDPFAVKLLPDSGRFAVQSRYFNMGRSASGIGVFSLYRTNGKQVRIICARPFTPEEQFFYQRKLNQALVA